jgi:hypothetical protein
MNLTEQLIRRGDHPRSVYALEADIRAWVKNWNADPNHSSGPKPPKTSSNPSDD